MFAAVRLPNASFDCFILNYVLELLSPDDILKVLSEAHRLLKTDGLMCLVSLTPGRAAVSRAFTRIWKCIHNRNPALAGGCRPLDLTEFFGEDRWETTFYDIVDSMGIAPEIVIAAKKPNNRW
ncbi:MAG: class I SAM-dependent methyltransferase [Geobacteraceae bacterium]|nr:class I SAM-dependent methyltransferase [Geobacteraceae bacterium]